MEILNYFPGNVAALFLEITDGYVQYKYRADGYAPIVTRVIKPDATLMSGFPVLMTHLDTGLYTYSFILPSGASSIGNYYAEVSYVDLNSGLIQLKGYHLIVSSAFGNYGSGTF